MSVRNKVGIYSITNMHNGKRYIGQSTDIYGRLSNHKTNLKYKTHKNLLLQTDYNEDDGCFLFETLCYCSKDELDDMEKYYISLYKANDPEHGYNTEAGGYHERNMCSSTRKKLSERFSNGRANFLGRKHTPESKRKMSESHKGWHPTQETLKKMSDVQKGKIISQHTRELISKAKSGKNHHYYGKTFSDEHKAKLSAANSGSGNPMYGKNQSEKAKRLIAIRHCKPVVCIETCTMYESTIDAAQKTGGCGSSIGKACRGLQETSGKKHWRFATEAEAAEMKEKLTKEIFV